MEDQPQLADEQIPSVGSEVNQEQEPQEIINEEALEHPSEHINVNPPVDEPKWESEEVEGEGDQKVEDPDGIVHEVRAHTPESHDLHHNHKENHIQHHDELNLDVPEEHQKKDSENHEDEEVEVLAEEVVEQIVNPVGISVSQEYEIIEYPREDENFEADNNQPKEQVIHIDEENLEEQYNIISEEEVKEVEAKLHAENQQSSTSDKNEGLNNQEEINDEIKENQEEEQKDNEDNNVQISTEEHQDKINEDSNIDQDPVIEDDGVNILRLILQQAEDLK